MERKISTAISDLILATTAIISLRQINEKVVNLDDDSSLKYAKWWFMLQAIAASFGVVKFGVCKLNLVNFCLIIHIQCQFRTYF